ncbi:hypothetical protein ACPV5U_08490 [Vibrio mediterranei]
MRSLMLLSLLILLTACQGAPQVKEQSKDISPVGGPSSYGMDEETFNQSVGS